MNSHHDGDRVTRHSHTDILLYFISLPIIFYSKWQNTVESSTFGLELVNLIIAPELIISMQYKLRIFGVPIYGSANVFCDNEAVHRYFTYDELQLIRSHESIFPHRVCECFVGGHLIYHRENTNFN